MAKEDGVRTVVVGGKNDVPQQYCGVVGGQSTDFAMVDTEIKACFVLIVSDIVHVLTWLARPPSSRTMSLLRQICM